ncbi:unnamed protein product [Symbiodinium microadriaticum]|nr:unnamed protein product [Symbiodinium microadriaticum]
MALLYKRELTEALGREQAKKDYARAWKVAIKAVRAMLRFKRGMRGWSGAPASGGEPAIDHTLRGFHFLPPTPLRRTQKELPPDTVELVLHGLKGELLMGPDVVSLGVSISQIKRRLLVYSRQQVIKGSVSRALQLYNFIALGAVVHFLHNRRAVDDLETLRNLRFEEQNEGTGKYSPDTMAHLAQVKKSLSKAGTTEEPRGLLAAPRLELIAVVFVHIYGVIAWGDASAGGSIPLSLSDRLSGGITFVVGNTRAFAAVSQSGAVTTWGDPACGGNSGRVTDQLKSRAFQICHNEWAFAAFREGGQIVCWGDPDAGGQPSGLGTSLGSGVVKVCSTEFAFAALKESGQVVTWGDPSVGGDSSGVAEQLQTGIVNIWANAGAFVAAKSDGSLVIWGDPSAGGDMSALNQDEARDIETLYCNIRAFAAIAQGGRVVAWGAPGCGGDTSAVASQLTAGVRDIRTNGRAFAAIKEKGAVVAWGNPDFGGDASATSHLMQHSIVDIIPSLKAFAALREDPMSNGFTVMTWGDPQTGGDSSAVSHLLIGQILQVVANDWAFAARRDDGMVVCWGDPASGGDSSAVQERIHQAGGAVALYKTSRAFAAVLQDGSICAWGEPSCGGDSTPAEFELGEEKVLDMCANDYAFAARTSRGSVVAWGHKLYGGHIEEEAAAKLQSGVTKMIGNKFSFLAMKRSGTYVTFPANDPADEMAPDAAGASTLGTDSLLPDQKLDAILNQWREKYAAFQRATQTVVGGVGKGGIIVRCTSAVGSEQLPQRLETGAVVQELSLQGERLHYELISGVGPPQGWVSTSLQGRALLERADEKADEVEALPDESALPALSASKWLAKYEHGKEAKCRLVCFFGAGHDAIGFAHWNQYVAEKHPSIELLLITLPGHGVNRHVPVQENAEALAKLAAEELLSLSEHFGPFALLGFSVGATASYALALEMISRGRKPLKLYVAGRAGPKVCFRPPAQEEIWALDSIGWIRWFVANFATEDDVKRTERLIQLSDGPNDGLLKSISSSQKADMLLGDSLAGAKLPAIETDLYMLASKADEVWPAEDSAKFGNRCCPAYMDCADTWKPYALGSTALKYFDELTHSELCTELLLEEVCRDLSAVMQDASDGRKDNACLSRAWKWLENDACTDGTWSAVASSAQKHRTLHVLSTDATVTNSKPARVGASREASESDDEAFLRKIKQEVGLDVGPIWDSLPTPGGGSAGGNPIAAEADLYPLPVALEEDFRHLRAALAADAEPQVWQEGAEAETHDGDDDANTSGPHEAAAADKRDKNAAQADHVLPGYSPHFSKP